MGCTYKQFKDERLCVNDLTHEITLACRTVKGDHPDDDPQKNTKINPIFDIWAAVETPSEYRPIQSSIAGRAVTHVFYVRYDDWADLIDTAAVSLDVTRHIVAIGCDHYRIDRVKNMNGRNRIMGLYCEYIAHEAA